jgi:hypothetical protein
MFAVNVVNYDPYGMYMDIVKNGFNAVNRYQLFKVNGINR